MTKDESATGTTRAWERVEVVFNSACDIEDTDRRAAFVREACQDDEELRAEVERLLAVSVTDDDFLVPPPLVSANLAGRTVDDFEVLEEIGRGGMGVVYRARQVSLGREVALKVLPLVLRGSDAVSERFRREAMAASKLRHPGIATVLAFGETDGTYYFAMELVDGPSLRDVMDRAAAGAPSTGDPDVGDPKVAAELVRQMAVALDYAHEHGVVHRDVKPHNVLLEKDGRVRLIDFGLAKLLDMRGVTLSGDVTGTPHYMSPEQAHAKGSIDRRADVYSLGAVLYELIARRTPHTGTTNHEVLVRIANDEPPPLRKVAPRAPRALDVLCQRALEREPDDRPATAAILAADLARYVAGKSIQTEARSFGERATRTFVRKRAGLGLAAATAAVLLALAWSFWPEPSAAVNVKTFTAVFTTPLEEPLPVDIFEVGRDEATDEPLLSFVLSGRFDTQLPIGDYVVRVDRRGAPIRFVSNAQKPGQEKRFFIGGRPIPQEDLVAVPAQTVDVTSVYFSLEEDRPVIEQVSHDVDSFYADPYPLSYARVVEAIEGIRGEEAAEEYVDGLVEAYGSEPNFDLERLLRLPATYLSLEDAQEYLGWYGLRLPTHAEAAALARGGEDWLNAEMLGEDTPLNIDRLDEIPLGLLGPDDFYAMVDPVDEPGPVGPLGLYHPVGNLTTMTSSLVEIRDAAGNVTGHDARILFGVAWWQEIEASGLSGPSMVGLAGSDRFVDRGVRGVRSID